MQRQTYTAQQIKNRHGQRIYMFSKQPGNTELEKCIIFLNKTKIEFQLFGTESIQVVYSGGSIEIFNGDGEKVGELEDISCDNPQSIDDLSEDIRDLGFEI